MVAWRFVSWASRLLLWLLLRLTLIGYDVVFFDRGDHQILGRYVAVVVRDGVGDACTWLERDVVSRGQIVEGAVDPYPGRAAEDDDDLFFMGVGVRGRRAAAGWELLVVDHEAAKRSGKVEDLAQRFPCG
jgi:hypothetical protein